MEVQPDAVVVDLITTAMQLQGLTAAVSYQQVAESLGLENGWASSQLANLAAVVEQQADRTVIPSFAAAYAEQLRMLATALDDGPASIPRLEVIKGGLSAGSDRAAEPSCGG